MKILLVIPCFNEQGNVQHVIQDIEQNYPTYDYIVVNDGSTDNTKEILEKNGIRHISLPVNCGLAAAFQTGVLWALRADAHYDAICQFDADGQHLPQFLAEMIKEMEEDNADIVIGSRFLNQPKVKEPVHKKACRKLISAVIFCLTGTIITDPTSGLRMYRDTVWDVFEKDDNAAPEPDTLVYFMKNKFRVKEIAVQMNERTFGKSYLTITKSMKYMMNVVSSMLLVQWWRK